MSATIERPERVELSEPLLDAAEVARLLGVKRQTVFNLARRANDPLPSIRLGRRRMFHRRTVEEWLARQSD